MRRPEDETINYQPIGGALEDIKEAIAKINEAVKALPHDWEIVARCEHQDMRHGNAATHNLAGEFRLVLAIHGSVKGPRDDR